MTGDAWNCPDCFNNPCACSRRTAERLVRAALVRIDFARARFRDVEMDAIADADDRDAARHFRDSAEREFAWQESNVRVLLVEREELLQLAKDGERFRYLIKHHESIGFSSGDREPDCWVNTKDLRKRVDAARAAKEKK